ncbi:MAG: homocysteine S-methyltransferase family protein [Clostridia bacterium]|nr:homocysteine S-methyltransferase family protein [Clostridia bacterium]
MKVLDYIKENITYLDGAMGTLLQARGLKPGEATETWNLSHKEDIIDVHKSYFESGTNIVTTNTFGVNCLKYDGETLKNLINSAIDNANEAKKISGGKREKFIAFDIGPTGRMLKPYGDLDFEDAVEVFAKNVRIATKKDIDLFVIETMNDSLETKAAVLAVKENSDLPVFVYNAYGEDEKLMTGATPEVMVSMLEGLGADVIGVNCSLGPKQLKGVVERILKCSSTPVAFKPNAGLPEDKDGKTVFNVLPEEFSDVLLTCAKEGVGLLGGCCGTTPEYIKAVVKKTENIKPKEIISKNLTVVSSYMNTAYFGDIPLLIGERINPTGKKKLKLALMENDMGYILNEGINEQEKGCHILDVNVGIPDIDEEKKLFETVTALQEVCSLPLQIDTSNAIAMEKALRVYNGKAMINSVNGKKEVMEQIFPIAKKYGGVIVALTLDENGIPKKAEDRYKIAEKIVKEAKKYGISKNDLVFDTLAMTVSTDQNSANETIKALKMIKENLGCHTSLGVSNISFGLPKRDFVNGIFFTLALENGLSAAIMNPNSDEMMKAYKTFLLLKGKDENCLNYIDFANSAIEIMTAEKPIKTAEKSENITLSYAIIKGLKDDAKRITKMRLANENALKIVNDDIIPALDNVGKDFEEKKVYLPQLLMSAEAAKFAFEEIKATVKSGESTKCTVVLATVKGDIHDIGKNIVKLLLQNYGFRVIDLGKDVAPEAILNAVIKEKAPVLGLSALMTTTVPAMEETIKLIHEKAPFCKTVVGGAVLNPEYAEKIGADKYAKDAMETVRYAEQFN